MHEKVAVRLADVPATHRRQALDFEISESRPASGTVTHRPERLADRMLEG
jgi:hypothetical protein